MPHRIDVVARVATSALIAIGMLVVPGHVSQPSVVRAADCPAPPVTIAKLVHLEVPGHHCYGSAILVFRAFIAPPCDECGGASATVIAPR